MYFADSGPEGMSALLEMARAMLSVLVPFCCQAIAIQSDSLSVKHRIKPVTRVAPNQSTSATAKIQAA
jgi:hypothetical protein